MKITIETKNKPEEPDWSAICFHHYVKSFVAPDLPWWGHALAFLVLAMIVIVVGSLIFGPFYLGWLR